MFLHLLARTLYPEYDADSMSRIVMGDEPGGKRVLPEHRSLNRLRVLSYNIQAGIDTRHYRDYLTQGWKHLLPHRERMRNLERIAQLLGHYDLVGLQEVDAGSLRSGFIDQTEYLARRAGFPFWFKQVNRNMGKLAQHSNGILTRIRPLRVREHKLPGLPGRGALVVELPLDDGGLFGVCVLHLALGRRARGRQLDYVADLVAAYPFLVLMGDFNCGCDSRELRGLMARTGLRGPSCEIKTFPSWRPMRNLDHILASPGLTIGVAQALNYSLSDHLPVSMEVALPRGKGIRAAW